MYFLEKKIYKNLFIDLYLIKYNIWKKKLNINFNFFLKTVILDKIIQLYSIFFIWLFSNKNFNIQLQTVVKKNYFFLININPRIYINFLFHYFFFYRFNDKNLKKENSKLITISFLNTILKLCEFFLIKHFFKLKNLRTNLYFFKIDLIFLKNVNFWKEKPINFLVSFFKK